MSVETFPLHAVAGVHVPQCGSSDLCQSADSGFAKITKIKLRSGRY